LPITFEILVNFGLRDFFNVFAIIKQVIEFVSKFFLKNWILIDLEKNLFKYFFRNIVSFSSFSEFLELFFEFFFPNF
jgi:hypothetical protein